MEEKTYSKIIEFNDNNDILNMFNYMNEEGVLVSIYYNSKKESLILNLNFHEAKKYNYSKEFTYENISQLYPIFTIEENIINIKNLLKESINNYGVKTQFNEKNENTIYLIIQMKINSKIKEIKLELDKTELSKEDFISLMTEKVNNLLDERKEIYGLKSFKQLREELNSIDEFNIGLESIENRLGEMTKFYKKLKETNLLSNSNIISNTTEIKLILNILKKIENEKNNLLTNNKSNKYLNNENIIFKLIYRATRDGDTAKEFHKRCDKIGPNLTLVKTDKKIRFGGFTNLNWEVPEKSEDDKKSKDGEYKHDPESFCFSLTNKKVYYHNNLKENAIFCSRSYGPTFSENIFAIYDKMLTKGGFCSKKEKSCFTGQNKDYEISGNNKTFKIEEVEVYEVISFQNELN